MKKHTSILFVLILVLVASFAAIPTYADPPPVPQAFYGGVQLNGRPAPIGTRIEARGAGVDTGIVGNPLVVTVAGQYGGPTGEDLKLSVAGNDLQDGTPISFYVNGVRAECAVPDGAWQTSYPFMSGGITELNLKARIYTYVPLAMR